MFKIDLFLLHVQRVLFRNDPILAALYMLFIDCSKQHTGATELVQWDIPFHSAVFSFLSTHSFPTQWRCGWNYRASCCNSLLVTIETINCFGIEQVKGTLLVNMPVVPELFMLAS